MSTTTLNDISVIMTNQIDTIKKINVIMALTPDNSVIQCDIMEAMQSAIIALQVSLQLKEKLRK